VRNQIALFLLGNTLALALSQSAHALDDKAVLQKMDRIPVFTLINDKGQPVVASPPKGAKTDANQIIYFFLGKQELSNFQKIVQKSDPNSAKTLKPKAVTLKQAMELGKQYKKNKVTVEINPLQSSLNYALKLAQAKDKKLKVYPGVPIFTLTDKSEKNSLSVNQNGQTIQPFFFDSRDAENTLGEIKKKNPDLAKNTKISVRPFQDIFTILKRMKDAKQANQIAIVPSSESLQYARSLTPAKKK
jgi:Tic22-like family